jgi:hypothetical protein
MDLEDLAKPGLTTLPVIALVVPEHQIIALEIMHDAINAAVTRNILNALALLNVLARQLIRAGLSLEQRDAEAARLEDANDMLDDICSLATTLACRDIGLERSVRAVRLRRDVHSEVVGGIRALLGTVGRAAGGGNNAVGGEAAGGEEVGVDAGIRVLRGGIDVGQTAVLGDNGTESVALGGQFFREGKLLVRVEARVVRRGLLEDIEALVGDVGGGSRVENSRAAEALALTLRDGTKRLDGVLAGLTSPLNIATFRDRTRVLEIELTRVLLIEVSHEYLQSLVFLFVGIHLRQHALRELHILGLRLRAVLRIGARRRSQGGVGTRDVEVPVLAVHFADHVGTAALEALVQEADFVAPAAMGTLLSLGVEEVLPAVKDAVGRGGSCKASAGRRLDVRKARVDSSDLEKTSETPEEGSGTTGLQHDLVGEDEHARLGEQVSIDVLRLNDGQDLAVDEVEHLLPDLSRHLLEAQWAGLTRQVGGRRAEPYFQELLGTLEGVGRVEVDGGFLVDSQRGRANVRRRRRGVVLGDLSSDHLLAIGRRGARSIRWRGGGAERVRAGSWGGRLTDEQ